MYKNVKRGYLWGGDGAGDGWGSEFLLPTLYTIFEKKVHLSAYHFFNAFSFVLFSVCLNLLKIEV